MKAFLEINRINLSKHAKQHLVYEIQHLAIAFVAGSAETTCYLLILCRNSNIICNIKKNVRTIPPKIIDPKL